MYQSDALETAHGRVVTMGYNYHGVRSYSSVGKEMAQMAHFSAVRVRILVGTKRPDGPSVCIVIINSSSG